MLDAVYENDFVIFRFLAIFCIEMDERFQLIFGSVLARKFKELRTEIDEKDKKNLFTKVNFRRV